MLNLNQAYRDYFTMIKIQHEKSKIKFKEIT